LGLKLKSGLSPSCELDRPLSDCFVGQLKFRPVTDLPTQSYICVLGSLLAVSDLDDSASRPDTDELTYQPITSGISLVMGIGQRLLNLVGKYVHYLWLVYNYSDVSMYVFVSCCCLSVFKSDCMMYFLQDGLRRVKKSGGQTHTHGERGSSSL